MSSTSSLHARNVAVGFAALGTYFGVLSVAGVLLVAGTLERSSKTGSPLPLALRPSEGNPRLLPELMLAGGASASLAVGTLAEQAPRANELFWLPVVLVALAIPGSFLRRRRAPSGLTAQVARLLLGISFCLSPLAATLYPTSLGAWALVCFVVWAAVHLLASARGALVSVGTPGAVQQTRLVLSGKGSALRNAIAAAVATGIDFCAFSLLVALSSLSAPVATFLAAVVGGFVNFGLNKNWTFSASGPTRSMLVRYATVSASSALLNATVVFVLMWLPPHNATLSWLIARGLVFLCWNFPLQRDYVFSHRDS